MSSPSLVRDTLSEMPRVGIELAVTFNPLVLSVLFGLTPRGAGEPVIVLPGFGAHDITTHVLRRFLQLKGYTTYGWDNGINIGPQDKAIHHMKALLTKTHQKHGQKISLIGHSMGGLYARALAKTYPDMVSRVVTLGSPFGLAANPKATVDIVHRVFAYLNPDARVDQNPALLKDMLVPPDMPTTSVFTRGDGVVHWSACLNPDTQASENIEIRHHASHCGLVVHPAALAVIADRLAAPTQPWKRLSISEKPFLYPFVLTDHLEASAVPALPSFTKVEAASIRAARPMLGLRAA